MSFTKLRCLSLTKSLLTLRRPSTSTGYGLFILCLSVLCLSFNIFTFCLAAEEEKKEDAWAKLDKSAQRAFAQKDYTEAERLWKEAILEAEKANQIEPGIVNCFIGLAGVNDKQGNFEHSEYLYEMAMRNMEGLVGTASQRYIDYIPELAALYHRHNKDDRAEFLYQKVIKARQANASQNPEKLAEVQEMYANFLRDLNHIEEAAVYETQAANIRTHIQMMPKNN